MPRRRLAAVGLVPTLMLAAGCATGPGGADGPTASPTAAAPQEATGATPRLVLAYDGGVQVLDAATLDVVADLPLDGFNRLNPAGDGRHVLITTAGGFQVLDAGTWADQHGDHSHYFVADPQLTDVVLPAEKPGHVVAHSGRTALFDDGTGEVVVFDAADVAKPHRTARTVTTAAPHHGVAVELPDGALVVSEGTADARTGIQVLDGEGTEVAASAACPGVHGEAVAADGAVVIGCEDGALVVTGDLATGHVVTKVASPDAYGRIGNQAGAETSPIVLGDYKSDPDAELERPTRVSLIDTRTAQLRLVDLPASYSFRSLGRGPHGEGLVLGSDGALHVIDVEAATLTRSIPVIDPWSEPEAWQEPRPTLFVQGGAAYITDPRDGTLRAVDLEAGEVSRVVELTVTPNELTGVAGLAASTRGGHAHHDH
ncbi:zinc metallochaperone AztD [Cellulomonas cellasea]|uniref:zinc metallochaperone AztD n=1 Tax=Cellulomonas cellasea TaxID=43670 RepID=UPI0025A49AC8|nr:zinc metallochaperone AztD [Cellulomonas cellasea]MDM8083333.1 zinc metallochaperone AztD [Cellulomonas cellasea]